MGKVKLVIFDLDGTLIDAYEPIAQSFNFAISQFGYDKIDDETIRRSVGWGEHKLIEPYVKPDEIEDVLKIYRKHHVKALQSQVKLLPNALPLLEELKKRKYLLSIASNRPTQTAEILIDQLKIKNFFDYIICGDKLKNFKPHPEILYHILEKFSLNPQEAAYIGDMKLDVETGMRARVRTIAVATGSNTKKELESENPYKLITDLSEVAQIIEEMNA